jgi:hypothetical protein
VGEEQTPYETGRYPGATRNKHQGALQTEFGLAVE